MLKNKISILSSSYIIPNHYSWKDNFKNEKIFDFKYVNNLNHGFHKVPRENILFSLIFVNDLINENKIYNNTEIKQISRSIINLVKIRLKTSNSPIIIFLVNYKSNNIFDYLSKKNHSEIIFDTLFNELLVLSKNYSNLILLNFNSLIENSKKSEYVIFADNFKFDPVKKDIVKGNKYRWDSNSKVWYKKVKVDELASEKDWLTAAIYDQIFEGRVEKIEPIDKYKL